MRLFQTILLAAIILCIAKFVGAQDIPSMGANDVAALSIADPDIRTVLEKTGEFYGFTVILPEDLQGEVEIDLENANSWTSVFRQALDGTGFIYRVEDGGVIVVEKAMPPIEIPDRTAAQTQVTEEPISLTTVLIIITVAAVYFSMRRRTKRT